MALYTELRPEPLVGTIAALELRIRERFPESGLSRVSTELKELAHSTIAVATELARPIWILRAASAICIAALLLTFVGFIVVGLRTVPRIDGLPEFLQASEAAVNEVILLALAIYFFVSLETRFKRRRALKSLHQLRSLVHIVDMHQLTKDPEYVLSPEMATASSPARSLGRFELARYLDYCSELLSLASKLAALHAQYLHDSVVLNAVNDIETLVASLSNKIWQKIMILDLTIAPMLARESAAEARD